MFGTQSLLRIVLIHFVSPCNFIAVFAIMKQLNLNAPLFEGGFWHVLDSCRDRSVLVLRYRFLVPPDNTLAFKFLPSTSMWIKRSPYLIRQTFRLSYPWNISHFIIQHSALMVAKTKHCEFKVSPCVKNIYELRKQRCLSPLHAIFGTCILSCIKKWLD